LVSGDFEILSLFIGDHRGFLLSRT
jgi:hypothetical protein